MSRRGLTVVAIMLDLRRKELVRTIGSSHEYNAYIMPVHGHRRSEEPPQAMTLGEQLEEIWFLIRDRGGQFTAGFVAVCESCGLCIPRRADHCGQTGCEARCEQPRHAAEPSYHGPPHVASCRIVGDRTVTSAAIPGSCASAWVWSWRHGCRDPAPLGELVEVRCSADTGAVAGGFPRPRRGSP